MFIVTEYAALIDGKEITAILGVDSILTRTFHTAFKS